MKFITSFETQLPDENTLRSQMIADADWEMLQDLREEAALKILREEALKGE